VAQLIRQSVQADQDCDEDDQLGAGEAEVEGYESGEGINLTTCSGMDGELDKQDSSCDENEFNVSTLPEDDNLKEGEILKQEKEGNASNTVADCGCEDPNLPDMPIEKPGLDFTPVDKDQDYFIVGGKEFTDSCTPANVFIPDLKFAIDDDHSGDCCFYQESYKTLLAKYDDAQETISQMKRNLGIVTEQLVSRDQLYSAHMVRLKEVFLQLEEQLEDTHKQQSLRLVLEPRGALRRRPFIPSHPGQPSDSDPPPSVLDQAIPPTPLLDSTLARDRMSLVHRGTLSLARRRGKGQQDTKIVKPDAEESFNTAETDIPPVPVGELYQRAVRRLGGAAALQDQLRKKVNDHMGNPKKEYQVEKISGTPPPSPPRASSLPTSPSTSLYSSTSSLQSAPGDVESPTTNPQNKNKEKVKKPKSGKSLFKLARRRLSSR